VGGLAFVALAVFPLLVVLEAKARSPRAPLLFFLFLNVAYVAVVGNLFENFENMRFRLEVEPLMLLSAAALIPAPRAAVEESGSADAEFVRGAR
jgi:hypothetical protein